MNITNKKTDVTIDVTFRPFQQEDATQMVDCFCDAYEDSYIDDFVYSPQGILKKQQSGGFQFYVAETAEGEIISINASEKDPYFPNQLECGCQVTKGKYQGFALGKLTLDYQCKAEAKSHCSFRAHPVAIHPISQKIVKSLGFHACGLLLNIFDDVKFQAVPNTTDKLSLVVAVKPVEEEDVGTLWIPEELQSLGGKMYKNLSVHHEFATKETATPLNGEGIRHVSDNGRHCATKIQVISGGEDFSPWLAQQVTEASEKGALSTVTLYLNAKDSSCLFAYEVARKQGFFFEGFLPCGETEYILLHNPLKVEFSLESLSVIEEYNPFVAFIRRQQHER